MGITTDNHYAFRGTNTVYVYVIAMKPKTNFTFTDYHPKLYCTKCTFTQVPESKAAFSL